MVIVPAVRSVFIFGSVTIKMEKFWASETPARARAFDRDIIPLKTRGVSVLRSRTMENLIFFMIGSDDYHGTAMEW
jgi:hypothetical protein